MRLINKTLIMLFALVVCLTPYALSARGFEGREGGGFQGRGEERGGGSQGRGEERQGEYQGQGRGAEYHGYNQRQMEQEEQSHHGAAGAAGYRAGSEQQQSSQYMQAQPQYQLPPEPQSYEQWEQQQQ